MPHADQIKSSLRYWRMYNLDVHFTWIINSYIMISLVYRGYHLSVIKWTLKQRLIDLIITSIYILDISGCTCPIILNQGVLVFLILMSSVSQIRSGIQPAASHTRGGNSITETTGWHWNTETKNQVYQYPKTYLLWICFLILRQEK